MAKLKKRTAAKKKRPARKKKRPATAKRRPAIRKKKKSARSRRKKAAPPRGKHIVKYVEKTSTEKVMNGRKKRSRGKRATKVHVARSSRRSVGRADGGGSGKLLIGLGIGALAIYLITRNTPKQPTYPTTLPQVLQTGNYTRNSQSQDLVNYAIAAGLAVDAISKLIDRLNSSSDQQVQTIYDSVSTTGDVGNWV